MGVIHKLKPEVTKFIIENKQKDPSLSCRALTQLVLDNLKVKVSKSSINTIFKENNLSLPIGRRQKVKKRKFNLPLLPVIEGTKSITVVPESEKGEKPINTDGNVDKRIKEAEEWAMKLQQEDRQRSEDRLNLEKQKSENDSKLKDEAADLRFLMEEAAKLNAQKDLEKVEEAKRFEQERLAKEAEEIKQAQETARKAEEERLAKIDEEKRIAEAKRLEEETARKAEEERLAKIAEAEAQAKKAEEEKSAQEAALKAEQERLAKEAEEIKQAQEIARQAEEERLVKIAEAEAQAKEAEAKKAEEERLAKEAEEIKQAQEIARKAEEEKAAQEAALKAEQEKLAQIAESEAKRAEIEAARTGEAAVDPERKILDDEKAAQEAALKAEKERWLRLAEEELKARQQTTKKELVANVSPAEPVKAIQGQVSSGIILLKAIDCLVGGSVQINNLICKELGRETVSNLNLTQALIFKSLFGMENLSLFWELTQVHYSKEELDKFYLEIQKSENIKSAAVKIFSGVFNEARGVGMLFSDGRSVYLDGQLHSTWTTQNIPLDFSSPLFELKNNLNKCFFKKEPLILFCAPGYDIPSNDFFNLLLNFSSTGKNPDSLNIFGNKLEEIETIPLNSTNNYTLLFGLWPWQFTSSRKVKRIGGFELKHIEKTGQDVYLGEIEIELLRASLNQSITFKGCAVKANPDEKIRLVILNSGEEMSLVQLAEIYLGCWPNLDEAFNDFSRKIELFAYASNPKKILSKESFGSPQENAELEKIFAQYIKMLDSYLRWHFLPQGYSEKEFSYTNECFYKLPVTLEPEPGAVRVKIESNQAYRYQKELEYMLRRLNERRISFKDGSTLYFENVSK